MVRFGLSLTKTSDQTEYPGWGVLNQKEKRKKNQSSLDFGYISNQ